MQSENQQQAADQVSISNSIGSLRLLGAMDWREFVETLSVVEQTLREDPGGVYGRMDFATRDRYRHAAEELAKGSRQTEGEVARQAIALARAGAASGGAAGDRAGHVGFYLIDKGVRELERAARSSTFRRRGPAKSGGPVPLAPLSGRNRADHGGPHRDPRWRRRMPAVCPTGRSRRSASSRCWPPVNWPWRW